MILGDTKLSADEVALTLRIPANGLTEIINGRRSYLGTSTEMWMNMQSHYELEVAEEALAERIDGEVQPYRKSV
jgi:plasmid maintenance system antidote protein VapI